MSFEVERKYRIPSDRSLREALRESVVRLGGQWAKPIEQADQYLAHPARDFAATDEALRIRSVGDDNVLTYKGPKLDKNSKTREELETPLAPGKAAASELLQVFERLGFRSVFVVEKSRAIANVFWQGADVEIALDDVRGAGQFVELEVAATQDELEAAKERIRTLALELGLAEADQERRSYLELVLLGKEAT